MNPIYLFEFSPSPHTEQIRVHLDLSKIIAVRRPGLNGNDMWVHLEIQLRDNFLTFSGWTPGDPVETFERFKREVDKLINAWIEYRQWEVNRGK